MLPGTLFLIDTSAMARVVTNGGVRDVIAGVIDAGMAATCITVELEAAYSARTEVAMKTIFDARAQHFTFLPVDERVYTDARRIMLRLAAAGLHRAAGSTDVLTAATAHVHRAIILHYDADFEHIASVTGQQHQWVAPRGSID